MSKFQWIVIEDRGLAGVTKDTEVGKEDEEKKRRRKRRRRK